MTNSPFLLTNTTDDTLQFAPHCLIKCIITTHYRFGSDMTPLIHLSRPIPEQNHNTILNVSYQRG